jgi:glycosyltransferase 2 family protein
MSDAGSGPVGPFDRRRLRTGLAVAVAIGVTVGLVVAIATGGRAVAVEAAKLPLPWLALALALSALSWVLQGLGLAALTRRGVKGHVLGMTLAFIGGDFAALVSPFGSGSIPASVFCLTREGLTPGESSAVVAMHSVLTGATFLIMGVIAALVLQAQAAATRAVVWTAVAIIAVALVFVVWLAARPRWAVERLEGALARPWLSAVLGEERAGRVSDVVGREAHHFAGDVELLTRERPAMLALSFACVFASRACLVACLPVVMYGLGSRGPVLPMLATGVAAMALAVVSPTPGGSGAVEGGTAVLLVTQAPTAVAGATTPLWRGVYYYAELLVGWFVFTRYLAKKGEERDAAVEEPRPGR